MKPKLLFLSFAFFSISLTAQSKKFEVSPIIGVEFPFANGNDADKLEYTPRPSVGAAFKVAFGENFTLQPEIALQLREVKVFVGNNSYRNSPVYIVVPVYLGYRINESFTLLAGPRVGMDLSFSASYSTGSNGSSSNSTGETPEFGGC